MGESMACLVGVWFVIGRLNRCSTCHVPVRTILEQMFVESVHVHCGTFYVVVSWLWIKEAKAGWLCV
jgi:hypothetical protein